MWSCLPVFAIDGMGWSRNRAKRSILHRAEIQQTKIKKQANKKEHTERWGCGEKKEEGPIQRHKIPIWQQIKHGKL